MRCVKSLLSILIASYMLTACSSSQKDAEVLPIQALYDKGQDYLQHGDYLSAIRYLDAIQSRFKQNEYSEQTQLSLIYANYKIGEYLQTLDLAERFARTYPYSASMDYVYYIVGLTNARLSDNFIQDLFHVNNTSRAVDNVRNAYGSFQQIVQQYPQSQYATDAQRWMNYLKNRLAENELRITQFYMDRNAYIAVVNRVEEMIKYYSDTPAILHALPLLQHAFEKMGITESAQKVAQLIEQSSHQLFPDASKPEYSEQF